VKEIPIVKRTIPAAGFLHVTLRIYY